MIPAVDKKGRPRSYVNGHTNRGKRLPSSSTAVMPYFADAVTDAEIAQRTATRRNRNGGSYQTASGWKHSPETIAKMVEAVRRRDLFGEANPFFGRTHTAEARARMGARGADHPQWKGGTGTLPYGPEFTRAYKRMIRERDGQTCQRCGVNRADYGRTLEVHHIDHDKKNNDPTNLATVCSSCNTWLWWHKDEPFVPLNRR